MAHKKSGGSNARQGGNVAGKRLGVKVFGGGFVKPGQIIVRQRGKKFEPGLNVGIGKDYTIFSKVVGVVNFATYNKVKKKIDVILLKNLESQS